MDYYSTLGIGKNASQEDIRKAYKKMSMQHHPDRGGDEEQFKKVNEAYQTLNDPQKKQMYDQYGTADPQQGFNFRAGDFGQGNPFEGMGGFEDIFSNFFGMGRQQGMHRNRTISVAVDITLEDVLTGKTIGMEIELMSGKSKVVTVDIPAGVEHGQTIRYAGIGDDSHRQTRPGDVIIQVRVRNHNTFIRQGDNIMCEARVDVFDLLIGGKTSVRTLEGRTFDINIPQGTQPDTVLSCRGEGLPNVRTKQRGNLLVKIKAVIPRNLTQHQLDAVRNLKNGI